MFSPIVIRWQQKQYMMKEMQEKSNLDEIRSIAHLSHAYTLMLKYLQVDIKLQ